MFYRQLTIPIHELENTKEVKCVYLSTEQKMYTEVTLNPNKSGTVADLVNNFLVILIIGCVKNL